MHINFQERQIGSWAVWYIFGQEGWFAQENELHLRRASGTARPQSRHGRVQSATELKNTSLRDLTPSFTSGAFTTRPP